MNTFIIASFRKSAGKTSIITGLAKSSNKKCAYLKPFGDRLLYKKKRLWDYDAAFMISLFDQNEEPDSITLGFEHSKIKYTYTQEAIIQKLQEAQKNFSNSYDVLFVEAGQTISQGYSVHLDAFSMSKALQAPIILVVDGDEGWLADDLRFIKKRILLEKDSIAGIICNKVQDPDEFMTVYDDILKEIQLPILGYIPHNDQLTTINLKYLSEVLFAKVIAGQSHINQTIETIFVGAMSTDAALRNPEFQKPNKLIVTSGDRSDMVLSALEHKTAGIILTNNILPPANIISIAEEKNIPLLLVTLDTYQVAKQLDDYDPLLLDKDDPKIDIITNLITNHINTKDLF